jgi:type I restriction enzyme S subunit
MKQGWEIKKIKDICDKASSNIAQNKIADIDGDYPVFGASGFVQNVNFFHRDSPYVGIVKDGAGVGRVNIYPAYSSLLGTLQYIIPKEGFSL